ncbi:MAG: hypothetical protein ACHQ53_06220 [Polyangiales bacterium]
MTHGLGPITLGAVLVLCSACGQVQQVSVGQTGQELDLKTCFGDGTDCPATVRPSAAVAPDTLEPQECVAVEEPAWHVVWERHVGGVPCPPIGQCSASVFQLADDGSVWTAGTAAATETDWLRAGFFLGHYGPDGEVLTEKVLDSRHSQAVLPSDTPQGSLNGAFFPQTAALAVDSRGRSVVAINWNDPAEPPWLATYDPSGRQVGDHVPLLGVAPGDRVMLGPANDRALMLSVLRAGAGTATKMPDGTLTKAPTEGILAKLDSDLGLVWAQTKALGPAPEGPSVDSRGVSNARVLSIDWPSTTSGPLGAMPPTTRVDWVQYDTHGNPMAIRPLDSGHLSAWDRDGNLLLSKIDDGSTSDDPDFTIGKFSASGEPLWTRHLAAEVMPDQAKVPPVTDAAGTTYVAGHVLGPDDVLTALVYHVDAAGQQCAFARVEGLSQSIQSLVFSASGEVYFAASLGTPGASIGRIAR